MTRIDAQPARTATGAVGLSTSDHALDLAERVAGACRARPITNADRTGYVPVH